MTVEYLTLGIYFAVLLLLGTLFSRFNRNLGDFVRGGSRGTWWMVGTSITMSGISAFTFTGNGSAAFQAGPSLLVIYLANLLGYAAGGLFLARWYRQTRAMTGADVIRARFGTVIEQFSISTGLVLGPLGSAVQLWALAVFVSSVFGLSLHLTIVVVGIIVLVYSVSGGVWAVMATDVVQGIVLYGITLLVAALAIAKVGGVAAFAGYFTNPDFTTVTAFFKEPGQFPNDTYTLQWAVVIFFMQLIGQVQLGSAGRYLAVKDGREATWAAWWAFCLMAVGSAVWFIPPMVARFLYADEVLAMPINDPATAAYAVIAIKVLPNGLLGIMIAAMFAATMSSMDSGITGQTGVIVNNLLGRIREVLKLEPLSDAFLVRLCRIISTVLGIVIIGFSLLLATQEKVKLFDTFLLMGAVIGTPILMPLLAGLIIRRLPSWSYFLIVGGAALPSLYALVAETWWGKEPWTIQERGAWVLGFGLLGILASIPLARFSSARQRERERKFFERMETPVDFEKEVGGGNDATQARLIGRVILLIAALLCLLLFLPNPVSGRLIILTLVILVGAVGGLLVWAARREARN
jgi:Na+/proline symporter